MKLTPTQKRFNDHIKKMIKNNERVLIYNRTGHVGIGYTLSNSYKKCEIMSFEQLLEKTTSRGLLNKLIDFITSINSINIGILGVGFDNPAKGSRDDKLGLNENLAFLKYLKAGKIKKRYKSPQYIIRADKSDLYEKSHIDYLSVLYKAVKEKKITKALLILSQEAFELINENFPLTDVLTFSLSLEDLDIILDNKTENCNKLNSLDTNFLSKFNLSFLIDNFDQFYELLSNNDNNIKKEIRCLDRIFDHLVERNNISDSKKELLNLLEFTTFFEHEFSEKEISRYDRNTLNASNMKLAKKIAILEDTTIQLSDEILCKFKMEVFKNYFYEKYKTDIFIQPSALYDYFRDNYPFEYLSLIRIWKTDENILTYNNQQSLIIIGYYFVCESYSEKVIREFKIFRNSTTISGLLLSLSRNFKNKKISNNDEEIVTLLLKKIKQNNILDEISSCASLVIILQAVKEDFNYFPTINFSDVLNDLKTFIVQINSDLSTYHLYWKLKFMEQYIALSLEDDNADNTMMQKFLTTIKNKNDEMLSYYIKQHNLRNFDRLALLSHSLGLYDAEDQLKRLFEALNSELIVAELARINYSACLIENAKYKKAHKILTQPYDDFYLKTINKDSYHANLNNKFVSGYLSNSIDIIEFMKSMEMIFSDEFSNNDDLAIKNNYHTACLLSKDVSLIKKGMDGLYKVYREGNAYNSFYALHNLLYYHFVNDNIDLFDALQKNLQVPKLLKEDTTFFISKFNFFRSNWNDKHALYHEGNERLLKIYEEGYLFSVIERWFE